MRRMTTDELSELEVLNLCGAERLGYPCNFEIDVNTGTCVSVTVSDTGNILPFGKREEYVIPWNRIECIGEDAILVRIPEGEICRTSEGKRKGCKHQ